MMYEPVLRRVREEVIVVLQRGDDRQAIRRAVRMQVQSALDEMEITALSIQQLTRSALHGAFQAAVQTKKPVEIVIEEAPEGVLEAIKEKGGHAAHHLKEAIQSGIAALEEYGASLKEKATEAADKTRKVVQSVVERLKTSLK